MTARDYRDPSDVVNLKTVHGYLITTSGPVSDPQVTPVTGTAATRTGPTIDVGVNNNARNGVIAQYVKPSGGSNVPTGITFEIQWSENGTDWYSAPSSAQGEARMSLITTDGNDRSMLTRAQVLTRYLRWSIGNAATLPAGSVYLWYGRL